MDKNKIIGRHEQEVFTNIMTKAGPIKRKVSVYVEIGRKGDMQVWEVRRFGGSLDHELTEELETILIEHLEKKYQRTSS